MEKETIIAKLRNKLSPIYNYFALSAELCRAESSEDRLRTTKALTVEGICVEDNLPKIRILLDEADQHSASLEKEIARLKQENAIMDRELDIVHRCLADLYKYDVVVPDIKSCLTKIRTIQNQPDNG